MRSTQTRSVFALLVWVTGKAATAKTHLLVQVVQKIGLCISLYDVLWTSEGLIGHGTGLVNVNGRMQSQFLLATVVSICLHKTSRVSNDRL
jgi:hypothetical protein